MLQAFWVDSDDLGDLTVRVDADTLDDAADVVGQLINDGAVTGFTNSGPRANECVIINWRTLRTVTISTDRNPDNANRVVASDGKEMLESHALELRREAASRGASTDPGDSTP